MLVLNSEKLLKAIKRNTWKRDNLPDTFVYSGCLESLIKSMSFNLPENPENICPLFKGEVKNEEEI